MAEMPLHLTKVAFGVTSVDQLAARWRARAASGEGYLTTRYLPKRHEEVTGAGSLYWIVKPNADVAEGNQPSITTDQVDELDDELAKAAQPG